MKKMIPSYYEFQSSVKLLSGLNALENIPFELNNLNSSKPLILTDETLMKNGNLKIITSALENSDYKQYFIFKDIPVDSSIEVIDQISDIYFEESCDSIIAIGGDSVINTAKKVIDKKSNPLIIVPTTSKMYNEASVVVVDPRILENLTPKLIASKAMEALTHSIEAYSCLQKNPISDSFAFSSIKMIMENIVNIIENPKDKNLWLVLSNASLMSSIAFSNSMAGITHALSHACSDVCGVSHSEAMAVLLPYCMEYNKNAVDDYYSELLLPIAGPDIYCKAFKNRRAEKAIYYIRDLINELHEIASLPKSLRELGVDKKSFEEIAQKTVNNESILVNPVKVSEERVIEILNNAY